MNNLRHLTLTLVLLSELLKRSYIDLNDLRQYRQLIINEHLLYGIDETEMARYIGDATNLATNKFVTNRILNVQSLLPIKVEQHR